MNLHQEKETEHHMQESSKGFFLFSYYFAFDLQRAKKILHHLTKQLVILNKEKSCP